MIALFFNFFMKSYVVGTQYNHLVYIILICNHGNSFIKKYAKNYLIAFIMCHSYWVIGLQTIHRTQQERKPEDQWSCKRSPDIWV